MYSLQSLIPFKAFYMFYTFYNNLHVYILFIPCLVSEATEDMRCEFCFGGVCGNETEYIVCVSFHADLDFLKIQDTYSLTDL